MKKQLACSLGVFWVALAFAAACGGDPEPGPIPPTSTPATATPTPTRITGPVPASNIPIPTRVPRPTPTAPPTATPVPQEVAFLRSARQGMWDTAGFAFDASIALKVHEGGIIHDILVTYAGKARLGYSTANLIITTPLVTSESRVITYGATSYLVDQEARHWEKLDGLSVLLSLTNPGVLFGPTETQVSDLVFGGGMTVVGEEMLDGLRTHVISGKLGVEGAESALDVIYRIGVEDGLLRQFEAEGDIRLDGLAELLQGISAEAGSAEVTMKLFDYVDLVAPHIVAARFWHDAVLMNDGRLLVTGGWTGVAHNDTIFSFPNLFAEVYDFQAATWSLIGQMSTEEPLEAGALILPSAVEMPNGKIMAIGLSPDGESGAAARFAPSKSSWEPLPSPPTSRVLPGAVLLQDGRVMIAGGLGFLDATSPSSRPEPLRVADIFNPATSQWLGAAPMNDSAEDQSLVLLGDGRAFMVRHDSAELYDPATDTWVFTSPTEDRRVRPTAVLLPDGRVLVSGRLSSTKTYDPTTSKPTGPRMEIYDPATDTWALTGEMSHLRSAHTLTLLTDGRVLAAGGEDPLAEGYVIYSTTEIFDPLTNSWSPGPELSEPRFAHSATLLPDGRVFLAGGIGQDDERYPLNSYEIVEP